MKSRFFLSQFFAGDEAGFFVSANIIILSINNCLIINQIFSKFFNQSLYSLYSAAGLTKAIDFFCPNT